MTTPISQQLNNLVQSKVPADPDAYDRAEGVLKIVQPVVELALTALTASGPRGNDLADDLHRRMQDAGKPSERMINQLATAVEVLGVFAQVDQMNKATAESHELKYGSMFSGGYSWSRLESGDVRTMYQALSPTLPLVGPLLEQTRSILDATSQGKMSLELVSLQDATSRRQSRAVQNVFDAFHGGEGGSEAGGNIKIVINDNVVHSAFHFPDASRGSPTPPPAPRST